MGLGGRLGSSSDLFVKLLKSQGIELVAVPYPSTSKALTDVILVRIVELVEFHIGARWLAPSTIQRRAYASRSRQLIASAANALA